MIWTTYLVKNKQKLKLWVGIMNLNSNVLIFFSCLFSFTSMYVMNSFSLFLTLMCWNKSSLNHLFHNGFSMVFVTCFDSDVVGINFRFYFSKVKGRIAVLSLVFFISRFMGAWIVALFLPRNVLFHLSSKMNLIAFLVGISLSSLRMCPTKFSGSPQ